MVERFIAGWNMPGCLPDSESSTSVFDEKQDAITFLVDEIEIVWGAAELDTDATRKESVSEECMSAHTALHNAPSVPLFFHMDGYNYWIEFYNEDDSGEGRCMACGHLAILDRDGTAVRHLDPSHDCDTCPKV